MTSKTEIQGWFDRGVREGKKYMIVVCDTFDREDYPSYASDDEECREKLRHYRTAEMQRVMEVYNLTRDRDAQMAQHRANNGPDSAL